MTPEELDESRRHASRMSDRQLAQVYVDGPDKWPAEAWTIIEQEVARRERMRRVGNLGAPEMPRHAPVTEESDRPRGTGGSKLLGLVLVVFGFLVIGIGASASEFATLLGVIIVIAGLVMTWTQESGG